MRKEIFLSAWKLVKEFGITLSKALTIAWKEFKLQVVADRMNELELKYMTSEERAEVKSLRSVFKELNIAIQSLKPVRIVEFNNSGAIHDYGIGAYNGD